jgi:hypothetical protein
MLPRRSIKHPVRGILRGHKTSSARFEKRDHSYRHSSFGLGARYADMILKKPVRELDHRSEIITPWRRPLFRSVSVRDTGARAEMKLAIAASKVRDGSWQRGTRAIACEACAYCQLRTQHRRNRARFLKHKHSVTDSIRKEKYESQQAFCR